MIIYEIYVYVTHTHHTYVVFLQDVLWYYTKCVSVLEIFSLAVLDSGAPGEENVEIMIKEFLKLVGFIIWQREKFSGESNLTSQAFPS